ncbi:uncharacterized protein N7500_002521 [Penicillium coprophilum]|uniref:uncharacterized protein n=1 Tax=Penicillium coprophilum TaxID=36646 RepID=UPI00238A5204|nr:uncharacterized protein N7500_002521 [Penicillium coprophilum]KAJ5169738.1 hypothetical protein N7500_002521 [Penicillium coprophilum]
MSGHSFADGEKPWRCRGPLKNGEYWGCGRHYGRKSNLTRHFRSLTGRKCINPLLAETTASLETEDIPDLTLSSSQTNAEYIGARTLNTSRISDVSSARPNILPAPTLPSIDSYLINVNRGYTEVAHNLLLWPSVKTLVHAHDYDQDYIMRLEEERGLTSVNRPSDIPSYTADDTNLPRSSLINDGGSCNGSRPSPNAPWIDQSRAFAHNPDMEIHQCVLLKLFGETARRYYQSYLDRMYKLHPFLDQQELDRKIEGFIKCHCDRIALPSPEASSHNNPGALRWPFDVAFASPGRPVEQNIDNVIILLIFALGAICESKLPLLGSVIDPTVNCRLPHTSVPLQASNHSFPSSTTEPKSPIPGLALYEYAATTLSQLQDDVKLDYIQACLLAGLYAGQLTHPFESHGWISRAARACQLLVQMPLYEEFEDYGKNLCDFAYWSCLQLESDLLMELNVPASGISRYESRVPLPKGTFQYTTLGSKANTPSSTMMILFYYSQIHLHKTLNQVPSDLRKVEKQGRTFWLSIVQEAQSLNLDLWRRSLPKSILWCDTEEPANEINAARMRATYYRTRYIIYRPLLYYVLHYGHSGTCACAGNSSRSSSASQTQPHGGIAYIERMINGMGPAPCNPSLFCPKGRTSPAISFHDLPKKLRVACQICVRSAIQNTIALDGIKERLVVPNMFGTAHAQFDNMLALAATYNAGFSELIERSTLDRLFKRTIRFLIRYGNNSPALRADVRVLTEIYSKLFGGPPVLADV